MRFFPLLLGASIIPLLNAACGSSRVSSPGGGASGLGATAGNPAQGGNAGAVGAAGGDGGSTAASGGAGGDAASGGAQAGGASGAGGKGGAAGATAGGAAGSSSGDAGDAGTAGGGSAGMPTVDSICDEISAPACTAGTDHLIANPQTEEEQRFNDGVAAAIAKLEMAVGQYLSGEAPVYRGTLTADDGLRTIAGSDVTASIVPDGSPPIPGSEGGLNLAIFSAADALRVRLHQRADEPGVTGVGRVMDFGTGAAVGGLANCTSCAPDLSTDPDTIDLDLVATKADAPAFTVTLTAHLERIPTSEVTLADLAILNEWDIDNLTWAIEGLETCGDEIVRQDVGAVLTEMLEGMMAFDYCVRSTIYTALWWINPDCATGYGLRDVEVPEPTLCCHYNDCATCGPSMCF